MLFAALATLFGIIHSPLPSGAMFLPWATPGHVVWQVATCYLAMALDFLVLAPRTPRFARKRGLLSLPC